MRGVIAEELGFFLFLIYSRLLAKILSLLKNPRVCDSFSLHYLVPAGLISRAVYPTVGRYITTEHRKRPSHENI